MLLIVSSSTLVTFDIIINLFHPCTFLWPSTHILLTTLDPRYNVVIRHRRPYCVIARTVLYWNEHSVYEKQRSFLSYGHTISSQSI